MRKLDVKDLSDAVAKLCIEACCVPEEDLMTALKDALKREESPAGKEILKEIIENNEMSARQMSPMCQDTGLAVLFVDVGQEVSFVGGNLREAINRGVAKGYNEGYLRKSVVDHPLKRKNTGDNTPAVIHFDIVAGDRVRIRIAPKGGGSENMSTVKMLAPAAGREGVKKAVVEWVSQAGANPCPPILVGVGLGGSFEMAALLAKKALLRRIGERAKDAEDAQLEKEILEEVNRLGIGPQGFGGRVTALDVFVESHPCHIASLPVAINIQCHSARHKEVVL
ncbi:MAG: fumarate hydratase [Planctomycetota bacterium]|nr:fumarate hydratase [Planctomycetota bacterium]